MNKTQLARNRRELEVCIQDGERPVYGFPHMNFSQKDPNNIKDGIYKNKLNWLKISQSIIRSQKGKSEVGQIMENFWDQVDYEK